MPRLVGILEGNIYPRKKMSSSLSPVAGQGEKVGAVSADDGLASFALTGDMVDGQGELKTQRMSHGVVNSACAQVRGKRWRPPSLVTKIFDPNFIPSLAFRSGGNCINTIVLVANREFPLIKRYFTVSLLSIYFLLSMVSY